MILGSFGAVYMVSDEQTNTVKAVKVFFEGNEQVFVEFICFISLASKNEKEGY
jgi:heme/copper-type cytochrome/quinol oxidase subunit 4